MSNNTNKYSTGKYPYLIYVQSIELKFVHS